jgi:hypothetical protein
LALGSTEDTMVMAGEARCGGGGVLSRRPFSQQLASSVEVG